MKKEQFEETICNLQMSCNAYMSMLYYVECRLFTPHLDALALAIAKLTDKEHWLDFTYKAAKIEPDLVVKVVSMELFEMSLKFLDFLAQTTNHKITAIQAELWLEAVVLLEPFVEEEKQSDFLSLVIEVILKNKSIFPSEKLSKFVEILLEKDCTDYLSLLLSEYPVMKVSVPEAMAAKLRRVFNNLYQKESALSKREKGMKSENLPN